MYHLYTPAIEYRHRRIYSYFLTSWIPYTIYHIPYTIYHIQYTIYNIQYTASIQIIHRALTMYTTHTTHTIIRTEMLLYSYGNYYQMCC